MSEFVIEKNVPLPPKRVGTGLTGVLRRMAVGDSVFVPGIQSSAQVSAPLQNVSKELGGKFTIRKEVDGVRIWRTA